MRYLPSLVTVRDIQPRTSRAEHPPEAIEALARQILASGALARPLLVRQTGLESFELLDGELAFHAAARAREIDPVQAEAVLAFLVTRENETELMKQLEGLRDGHGARDRQPVGPTGDVSLVLTRLEQHLTQQFRRFEDHQRQENEAFRRTNLELQACIPQPIKVLALLNGADDDALLQHLKDTGSRNAASVFDDVVSARRAALFSSVEDAVKRAKGLTPLRALKLVDACEGRLALKNGASAPRRQVPALA